MTFSISSGAEENLYASIGNIQLESGGPGSGKHETKENISHEEFKHWVLQAHPKARFKGPNAWTDSRNGKLTHVGEYDSDISKGYRLIKKSVSAGGKACNCQASWEAFKKDPSYDNYMRAHRVRAGKVEAMSPPGYGGTVQHMVKDHPQISNPHALAWYMYEKGDKSHVKAPKGTGAKTVSKKVKEKRSKALKKKASAKK